MIDLNNEIFKTLLGDNKPSSTQLEIVNFVAHGIGNATVQSSAGSGKSKTIELAVAFVPKNKKVLVVSYNKHIAKHLQSKFSNMNNVDVRTYHSLGLKILSTKLKRKFEEKDVNENKYKEYISENINNLSSGEWENMNGAERCCYKKNIERLVDFARYNQAQSVKEIQKVALKYHVPVIHNEIEATRTILKWGSENISTIDYTDMIWLPYELSITANMPNLLYDIIFIDEAQDSSLIQQSLINICKKRNSRFLAFGDSKQTINAWCGSDAKAFANFAKQANTRKYRLNVSYRCSKKVAEQVQKYVKDFSVPDNAIEGYVKQNASLDDVQSGDLVLCRTTSSLVKLHMKFLKENKPSKINGLELGKGLIQTLQTTGETDIKKAIDTLYGSLFKHWEALKSTYSCSLRDVVSESSLIQMYDEIQSIEAISENLTTVDEAINKLQTIFVNDCDEHGDKITDVLDDTHIHLSTVHRAKGLEATNVYILCPSLMPSRLATEDWEIEAEDNLIYVAWSRAKIGLNFVSEKEFNPPKSFSGIEDLYNELIQLKEHYEKKK